MSHRRRLIGKRRKLFMGAFLIVLFL